MSFLMEFAAVAMTAIFLENVVFSRALGTSRVIHSLKGGKNLLLFGVTLTVFTTISSVATFFVNELWRNMGLRSFYRPFMFVVAISIIYVAIYCALKYLLPNLYKRTRYILTYATFNCALLGSVFLAADQNFNLAKTMGFGFGAGIGFTLATLLVFEGKRRILLNDVPKSFRGFPITLMYLGLVALAMYGLVGHQLPF